MWRIDFPPVRASTSAGLAISHHNAKSGTIRWLRAHAGCAIQSDYPEHFPGPVRQHRHLMPLRARDPSLGEQLLQLLGTEGEADSVARLPGSHDEWKLHCGGIDLDEVPFPRSIDRPAHFVWLAADRGHAAATVFFNRQGLVRRPLA